MFDLFSRFSPPCFLHLILNCLLRLLIFLVLLHLNTSCLQFGRAPPPSKAVTPWNPNENCGFGKKHYESRSAENLPSKGVCENAPFLELLAKGGAQKKVRNLKKLYVKKYTPQKNKHTWCTKISPKRDKKETKKKQKSLETTVNIAQNYLSQHFNCTLANILTSKRVQTWPADSSYSGAKYLFFRGRKARQAS